MEIRVLVALENFPELFEEEDEVSRSKMKNHYYLRGCNFRILLFISPSALGIQVLQIL